MNGKLNRPTMTERGDKVSIPVIAFEGVGGSGKSHLMNLLANHLEQGSITTSQFKISGLGNSSRVQVLKAINEYRERIIREGNASKKILEDKRRDKVFRLATSYQVRLFEKERQEGFDSDVILLDRTPLMPWVYAMSKEPENPYLNEILEDGLESTRRLGISVLFFIDISAEIAYSRILGRMLIGREIGEVYDEALAIAYRYIGASQLIAEEIAQRTVGQIIKFPNLQPKPFAAWDFIPYQVMQGEIQNYHRIMDIAAGQIGLNYVVLNGEEDIDSVLQATLLYMDA